MIDIEQLEYLVPGYKLTDLVLKNGADTVTVTLEYTNTRFSLLREVKAAQQITELEPFLRKPMSNPRD